MLALFLPFVCNNGLNNLCKKKLLISFSDKKYNESIPKAYHDNVEVGTVGIDKLYTRLTFVCYLRENLINCPDNIDPRFLTKSGHSKIK